VSTAETNPSCARLLLFAPAVGREFAHLTDRVFTLVPRCFFVFGIAPPPPPQPKHPWRKRIGFHDQLLVLYVRLQWTDTHRPDIIRARPQSPLASLSTHRSQPTRCSDTTTPGKKTRGGRLSPAVGVSIRLHGRNQTIIWSCPRAYMPRVHVACAWKRTTRKRGAE
jgi:hypothetical protein